MTAAALLTRVRASTPRARLLAAGALLLALALAVLGIATSRDMRVALFATPLHGDQLAEVEQRLAAWNVPHASSADNVRVAPPKRGELLLRLALAGVPHPHLAGSSEALAHVGALTPQSILETQTRDALAADLALGLRGVAGVADARIVIAPSSGGVYADEPHRDASASVRVTLAPGARLAARTLAGIKAFVAGGVPGLDAERVTVLDDRGPPLEGDGDDGEVQSALQSALDAAFGARATIVRAHREPLGEQREVREVRRAAQGGPIARTASDERYASGAKKYSKNSATEDRGSASREERRVAPATATARLTVAVFVDGARGLDLTKIRALAAATAGIRADRGDTLSVEAVAFGDGSPAPRAARTPAWVLAFASLLPQVLAGATLVLAVAFGARPLAGVAVRAIERTAARSTARGVTGIPPARVYAALDGEPPHIAAAIIAALPAAAAAAVLELYPPETRAAIVRRLARANATLVPAPEELIRDR